MLSPRAWLLRGSLRLQSIPLLLSRFYFLSDKKASNIPKIFPTSVCIDAKNHDYLGLEGVDHTDCSSSVEVISVDIVTKSNRHLTMKSGESRRLDNTLGST